jgi:uncharacterized protein (TIGR02266 family)
MARARKPVRRAGGRTGTLRGVVPVRARPLVTLLSDFGAGSGYPAQVKGAVLRALPQAAVVDLSHEIPHFDVLAGALLLEACVPAFPEHAVHVAVVDPGVGTARRPICVVDPRGRRLVGPDNGIFTPFLGVGSRVFRLADPRVVPHPRSTTFHGRDLFAPVAAWLAAGNDAARVGPRIEDPVRLDWPVAHRHRGEVRGAGLRADSFGNVITSITSDDLAGAVVREVRVAGREARFVSTFGDGEQGELLALIGSSGRMEIAVREGSAAAAVGAGRGTPVEVRLDEPALAPGATPATLKAPRMTRQASNQRKSNRLYHELPVAYRSVGSFLTDWATNISQGGLFINTRHPLPVGTQVKILIQLPVAAFPVDLVGRVTRVTEFGNEANVMPGMGIEFTDVDAPKREQLEAFVQKLRAELGA